MLGVRTPKAAGARMLRALESARGGARLRLWALALSRLRVHVYPPPRGPYERLSNTVAATPLYCPGCEAKRTASQEPWGLGKLLVGTLGTIVGSLVLMSLLVTILAGGLFGVLAVVRPLGPSAALIAGICFFAAIFLALGWWGRRQ